MCPKFFCRDKKALRNHKKSIMHRQNMVLKAGAAYEPAQGRALYCRVCVLTFADADALMRHRSTESHKQKVREDRRASYCHLCKKQFTSATQLKEHLAGKRHNELLETSKAHWRAQADARRAPPQKAQNGIVYGKRIR